jgi:hypothetical protein
MHIVTQKVLLFVYTIPIYLFIVFCFKYASAFVPQTQLKTAHVCKFGGHAIDGQGAACK